MDSLSTASSDTPISGKNRAYCRGSSVAKEISGVYIKAIII